MVIELDLDHPQIQLSSQTIHLLSHSIYYLHTSVIL